MKKILIVDDDALVAAAICRLLGGKYQALIARAGHEGLEIAIREQPDLILLDLHLPELDGMEICRRLREHPRCSDIPVIMVTGDDDLERRVEGLTKGADDFLGKPFHTSELHARIVARLRRRKLERESEAALTVGNLRIDPGAARAWIRGKAVELTHLEFHILLYFARNLNQLVTRKRMLGDLWPDSVVSRRTVDAHVAKLRKRLQGFDGALDTVYGGGYMLKEPGSAEAAVLTSETSSLLHATP